MRPTWSSASPTSTRSTTRSAWRPTRSARCFPGVAALPTSFFLDREGRIVQKHIGLLERGADRARDPGAGRPAIARDHRARRSRAAGRARERGAGERDSRRRSVEVVGVAAWRSPDAPEHRSVHVRLRPHRREVPDRRSRLRRQPSGRAEDRRRDVRRRFTELDRAGRSPRCRRSPTLPACGACSIAIDRGRPTRSATSTPRKSATARGTFPRTARRRSCCSIEASIRRSRSRSGAARGPRAALSRARRRRDLAARAARRRPGDVAGVSSGRDPAAVADGRGRGELQARRHDGRGRG